MPCRRRLSAPWVLGVTATVFVALASLACSSPNSDEPAPGVGNGGAGGSGGTEVSSGSGGEAGACDSGTAAASSSPIACSASSTYFASEIVAYEFGPGQATGQEDFPEPVFGPPEGMGATNGAVSGIVSLGNGGTVIVGFEDNAIVDAPGPDFIVFENPFYVGGNADNVFAELASVAVSDDGEHWVEFPCTASEAPYGQCAGWHPTLANAEQNDLDPTDPAVAGGDAFDLADVCVRQARYVRITDRADLDASLDGVFDLDAVSIVHAACPSQPE